MESIMLTLKNLLLVVLFLIAFTSLGIAQPPAPSNSSSSSGKSQNKEPFVYLDDGFSIDLPKYIYNREGIGPKEGAIAGGNQFVWQIPEGIFTIVYLEYVSTPADNRALLKSFSNNLIQQYIIDGGKLLNQTEISLNGNPGMEIRIQLKSGGVGIARYYLVKNWLYVITGVWGASGDGAAQLKILDSFKLVDSKAYIAQKLEEATPKPLPQSPVVGEQEFFSADLSVSAKQMTFENHYNENGNRVKNILYDYRGNPDSVAVYGYIDGMRVSNHGYVTGYDYTPPPPKPTPSAVAKPLAQNTPENKPVADNRFRVRYEYKYENNRLKETTTFSNTGIMTQRIVYTYEGNKIEKSSFDREGKLTFKTVEVYDDKGNLIEKTFVSMNSKVPDSKYTYTYETFDEKGNWTKRKVLGKQGQYDGGHKDQQYIEHRKITYFQ
jgi:hypothetical protein